MAQRHGSTDTEQALGILREIAWLAGELELLLEGRAPARIVKLVFRLGLRARRVAVELEEVCQKFGVNYQTAMNAKSVCSDFEFSRRRENLTFSHHQEVQGRDDAEELLDWCEETDPPRSCRELREKIGQLCPPAPPGERGQGRSGKESSSRLEPDLGLAKATIAAYRKLAKHVGAERAAGALLREMEKNEGGRPSKTGNAMLPVTSLDDLGITKMQSSRWQTTTMLGKQEVSK